MVQGMEHFPHRKLVLHLYWLGFKLEEECYRPYQQSGGERGYLHGESNRWCVAQHINFLEIQVVLLVLQHLLIWVQWSHVLVRTINVNGLS